MNLYLEQIAKWLENTTGAPQQILHTSELGGVRYIGADPQTGNMTVIADADISVNSISWSGEYGIALNSDKDNGEKVHVILWSDNEVFKDEQGYYMESEDALNGVLLITNPDIKITGDIVKEMLAVEMDGFRSKETEIPKSGEAFIEGTQPCRPRWCTLPCPAACLQ